MDFQQNQILTRTKKLLARAEEQEDEKKIESFSELVKALNGETEEKNDNDNSDKNKKSKKAKK